MLQHKYRAQRTEYDGINFASKLEAEFYKRLCLWKRAGEVIVFLRQPAFHLSGGVIYRADFQVFWRSGDVEFIDVKGVETDAFKRTKKQVEDLYAPIKIKVVKKNDF